MLGTIRTFWFLRLLSPRIPQLGAVLLSVLAFAAGASAQPDLSGSVIISEPNGSPGLCTSPCYAAEKSFEVFLAGNSTSPGVCAVGEYTYLYSITHIGGNPLLPPNPPIILPITEFEIEVPSTAANVSSAGFIPGPGIAPTWIFINTIEDVVSWEFRAPPLARRAIEHEALPLLAPSSRWSRRPRSRHQRADRPRRPRFLCGSDRVGLWHRDRQDLLHSADVAERGRAVRRQGHAHGL